MALSVCLEAAGLVLVPAACTPTSVLAVILRAAGTEVTASGLLGTQNREQGFIVLYTLLHAAFRPPSASIPAAENQTM